MSSTLSPEQRIIDALTDKLKSCCDQVLLGYSGTGLNENLKPPVILIQLESLSEQAQQGSKRKYQLQFNLTSVVATKEDTTYELLKLSRSIRSALNNGGRICPEARKHSFSDTLFDISPNHSQLSFADMTVTIEAIL